MTVDNSQNQSRFQGSDEPRAPRIIENLMQFDGPAEQFLAKLLAAQCSLAKADAAAILRTSAEGAVNVLAVYPQLEKGSTAPTWLAQSVDFVRKAIPTNGTTTKSLHGQDELYGQLAGRHLVMIPMKTTVDTNQLIAVFLIKTTSESVLESARERLELTANLLGLYEMRLILQKRQADLKRLYMAMETLSAANRQKRFTAVAMAFCNEAASQWQCERASLGFLKGRYVQLKAMSHTEQFSRKMKVVQDIEAAMEECLDQDIEIVYPAAAEASYISRAAEEMSRRYGPLAVLSLPLRQQGRPMAVLTLEREAGKPFTIEEIETARLTCQLCTARLLSIYEYDRWFGARIATGAREAAAAIAGPKHASTKIAAILIFAVILFLIFGKGRYRAQAPFVLEAIHKQFIPAPFDGYIKSVTISVGDMVEQGKTKLAQLETAELFKQLAGAKAQKTAHEKQAAAASLDGQTAQAQIAQAEADRVKAQIELLQYQIKQADIIAPIGGTVVEGELERQIGAPVKTGDILFEIAAVDSLRAELLVPEDTIADIKVGQTGTLAAVSYPARKIDFVVERINPMAEVVNQRNVFKVRARLETIKPWMRPGMEGVAKISVDRRSYAWIWTHRFVNWLRMKFW